jgi:hypothetical protein
MLIHSELDGADHQDAFAFLTVQSWQTRFRHGGTESPDDPRSVRPCRGDFAEVIVSILKICSFSFCKLPARPFRVATVIGLQILHNDMGR